MYCLDRSRANELHRRCCFAQKLPKELYKDVSVSQLIFNNPEQEVRVLAGEFFSRPGGVSFSIQNILALQGEVEKGQLIYSEKCSTCHQIGDVGTEIGPDLKYIRQKFDKTALTDAILNPNGAITFGYEPVLITAKNDQVYSGFLLSEGETTVIKDVAGNRHTIPREDILEKSVMNTSLMPDPAGLGMNEQDLADVVAYLRSVR